MGAICFVLTGCNIFLGEPQPTVYDLKYNNKTENNLSLLTYYKGEIGDDIKIKKKTTCNFNNVIINYSIVTNPVFKLIENTYYRDSIVIVQDEIFIDKNNKKFKKYILIINNYFKVTTDYDSKYVIESTFNLEPYSNYTRKKRSTFALNKGAYEISINFEYKDFENGLKMYDYEKRGL